MNDRAEATEPAKAMPAWERAARFCLNLSLLIILALQISAIVILKTEGEIPVPTYLLVGVKEQLHEQDIELIAQNIHFDLRGSLFFTNTQILHKQSRLPIARADKLFIKISLLRLAFGTVSLEQLSLRNGVLLCPAPYSPSGVEEALVNDTRIDLQRRGDTWHILRAVGRIRTAIIRIEGSFPEAPSELEQQKRRITGTAAQLYLKTASRAITQLPYLNTFKNPIISTTIDEDKDSHISLNATLASDSWQLEDTLQAQNPVLNIGYQPLQPRQPMRLKIHFRNLISKQYQTSIENIYLFASALPNAETISRASVFAENIQTYEKNISDCWGEFDIRDFPYISGSSTLTFGKRESHASISGEANLNERNAHLQIQTRASMGDLTTLASIDKFQQSNAPILAEGKITIKQGELTYASFQTHLQQLTIDHLTLGLVSAEGEWEKESLALHNVEVHTTDWAVQGEYFRNLKSNEDQLYIRGSLNPHDLSAWMEPWWTELWQNFAFGENYMNINLEVRDFMGGEEPEFLYGFLYGYDFDFRSVPIDYCSTRVRIIPDYIEVFGLNPRGPRGYAVVNIAWVYRPAYKSRYLVRFDAKGRLPLPDVEAISGGEITEVLDIVTTQQTPRLAVRGTVFGDTTPLAGRKHIDLSAYSPGTVHAFNLPMQELSLEAYARPDKLLLHNLQYTLAEGTGTGNAQLHHDTEQIQLDIDLTQADSQTLFSFLPLITEENPPKTSNTTEQKNTLMKIDGKADLRFIAEGKRGKLDTYSAEGNLNLYEAKLGKLHMLGGLSRLLAITPLKVGTFSFNNAQIPFQLNNGTLESTRITINGPTAQLEAYGSINLLEDDLDLTVRLLMSKNISTPIIGEALRLLDPVTGSFIFNVTGSPDDPEWKMAVNPFSQDFKKARESNK